MQFATGEWIGIELLDAEGKNDGSVANVRYFTCPDKHGLFVKRLQVKLDKDAPPEVKKSKENEVKPPSKLPSFDEKKALNVAASAPSAPLAAAAPPTISSNVEELTAPPPPVPSVPEIAQSEHDSQSQIQELTRMQEELNRVTNDLHRERVENEILQNQQKQQIDVLRQRLETIETEKVCAHTDSQNELENKIHECNEILLKKDKQIEEFEKRVLDLVAESDRDKENFTREISMLKALLEQQKTSENSDQQQR